MNAAEIIRAAGLDPTLREGDLAVRTPIDGSEIARVRSDAVSDVDDAVRRSQRAFTAWRAVPAPRRGEFVRLLGNELRRRKEALGALVALESGKIRAEGEGEVQEMIDICDFAVGQSRQLYGLTITSERPGHAMRETWHPLGPCAVITAFNFPVAVWAWNAALALVAGDPVIWKPSEKTPLTALACLDAVEAVSDDFGGVPDGLVQVLIGGPDLGAALAEHPNVPVVSATGSTRMGREVSLAVAERLGRCILELGGNNAMIVAPSADLELAVRAIVFSAVGTAGQRCTTLRRLIVHDDIHDEVVARLGVAYEQLAIGDPLAPETLVGPLIDGRALRAMHAALDEARVQGGDVTGGERVDGPGGDAAYYVRPAIVTMDEPTDLVRTETFAPILYVLRWRELEEAIRIQNDVPQGLSSCIFTTDVREAERFLAASGSDCGIANVNIGPSGAEIGGAFGGEKDTGGGRESGSDAWKGYMRRQTATVNWSSELPLAQGIEFGPPSSPEK